MRLISHQREQAKQHIYQRISAALSPDCQRNLDSLVAVDESRLSPLQVLKEVPKRAAPQAMLRLLEKLEQIVATGILTVDLAWLNNYQRSLTRYVNRCSANRFNDFAIEFYSFVADNYAPFYTMPIECTDRDAAYVLDGLIYKESDLALEEHYTDAHGYTEINFAAFAMLGRRFAPRIRNLQQQRIYRIDPTKDYKALSALLTPHDRTIHLEWIADQWDRMGHFYASLEAGHVTASTALKRLVAYSGRNHFYRAHRELGRVLKTEHILRYMSDPLLRQRTRRGLLKGEQIHALAREVGYGKQGRMTARDWQGQQNSARCPTLIMASIIYWQAKEINRVLNECNPGLAGVDLSLLEHISPIGWENIILYGEYVLNRNLIQL